MVQVDIVYRGQLRCEATHGPSGNTLLTDPPVDNMGKGEAFSPTDLVATATGTCVLTIMGILAQRHGLDIEGTTATVTKEMTTTPPRRIARLGVTVTVPKPTSPEMRQVLEQAAHGCPVVRSLNPEIEVPMRFCWAGENG